MSDSPFGKEDPPIRCIYCGYILKRPYPTNQRCPNCGKILDVFGYVGELTGSLDPHDFGIETDFKIPIAIPEKRSPPDGHSTSHPSSPINLRRTIMKELKDLFSKRKQLNHK